MSRYKYSFGVIFVSVCGLFTSCMGSYDPSDYDLYEHQPVQRTIINNRILVMDQLYSIGSEREDGQGLMLGNVGAVAIDDRGHTYIGDNAALKVYEVNENGEYVREYGSRGRGPGEIRSIKGIDVDDDVIIWDANNRKFEIFSLTGIHLRTVNFEDASNGKMVISPSSNVFAILFSGDSDYSQSGVIYHEYDRKSFAFMFGGIASEDVYPQDIDHRIVQSVMPGMSTVYGNMIFYVTNPYNGIIYQYLKSIDTLSKVSSFSGSSVPYPPLVVLQEGDSRFENASMKGMLASGRRIALDHSSESKGLIVVPCDPSQCIVNFYATRSGRDSIIKYDIIDLNTGDLSSSTLMKQSNTNYIKYLVAFNQQRMLLAVSSVVGYPRVDVYKLKIDDL